MAAALIGALALSLLTPVAGMPTPVRADGNGIREIPVQPAPGIISGIASVAGDIWFGDGGNIDTVGSDNSFTKYPLCPAGCGSPEVKGMAAAPAIGGKGPVLWFAEDDISNSGIDSLDVNTRVVTLHPVNSAATRGGASGISSGVAVDATGNPWFGNLGRDSVECYCTRNGTTSLEEYPIPRKPGVTQSFPQGFTLGPDGTTIWFTEANGNALGHLDPAAAPGAGATAITEIPLSAASGGIAAGPGFLWFTFFRANSQGVARMNADGSSISEFPTPSPPGDIIYGGDGILWYTAPGSARVGRMSPAGDVHEYFAGSSQSTPGAITAGPDGNVWFADDGTKSLGVADVPALDGSDRPGAPTNVSASADDRQATVTFTPPAYTGGGGSAITSYTATSTPGGFSAVGPGPSLTVTGLSNGTGYTFTVSATNAVGAGPSSLKSRPVTPLAPTVPGPPTSVTAVAGYGQATVSFQPPADDGRRPVTTYTATSNPDGLTATGRGSPLTVTGLTNGTSYTIAVTAHNVVGNGPPAVSNPVVPAKPAVTGLSSGVSLTYGGAVIDITGTNFSGVTGVAFGGVQVKPPYWRVNSDTLITATIPAHADGVVDVAVTVSAGSVVITSDVTPADRLRYSNEGWLSAGSMNFPRSRATATLLDGAACHTPLPPSYCGKVLVAGGDDADGVARNDGEVYDPNQRTWTTVPGSMSSPRDGHVAAALPGGQVLVAGGFSEKTKGFTADLYDPAANGGMGEWTRVPDPGDRSVRGDATATALPDGRVLVAGGYDGTRSLSTTLVFVGGVVPTWTSGPEMGMGRYGHRAVVIDGGNSPGAIRSVLVAGGCCDAVGNPLNTAEELDAVRPSGATAWRASGTVAAGVRDGGMAVLKSGRVVMPIPSGGAAALPARTAVYTPAQRTPGSWSLGPPMADSRSTAFTITSLPDGRVLVAGGSDASSNLPPDAEILDPAAGAVGGVGAWRFTYRPMNEGRESATATALGDGRVLVTGGTGGGDRKALRSAEMFSSSLPAPPMEQPVADRLQPADASVSGSVVTFEGTGLFPAMSATVAGTPATIVYNTDMRVTIKAPPHAPGKVDAADVRVVTTSGSARAGPSLTYYQGGWQPTAGAKESGPRRLHQAVTLNPPGCRDGGPLQRAGYPCGDVLVAGGDGKGSSELYDPARDGWLPAGRMSVERGMDPSVPAPNNPNSSGILPANVFTLTLLPDGSVLAVGGCCDIKASQASEQGWVALSTFEVFDPMGVDSSGAVGTWRPPVAMSIPRMHHSATLLDGTACHAATPPGNCGKVLVAGGIDTGYAMHVYSNAQLFDPLANAGAGGFTSGDQAGSHRAYHTATLLANGGVLIVGGLGHTDGTTDDRNDDHVHQETQLDTAEVYDLGADGGKGAFVPTTAPQFPRTFHTATRLDSSGCNDGTLSGSAYPCGDVLVTGGVGGQPSQLAELYDPAGDGGNGIRGTWKVVPGMQDARSLHSATLLGDGRLLVTGGALLGDPGSYGSAETYDPTRGGWTRTSSMRTVMGAFHVAAALDPADCGKSRPPAMCGRVLVTGASLAEGPYQDGFSELYTPVPAVRSLTPSLGPSEGGALVVIGGAGFTRDTTVAFGGVPATDVSVDSTTSITARSPKHRAMGSVEVVLSNAEGTSTTVPGNPAAQYGYDGCVGTPGAGELAYRAGYSMVGLPAGTSIPAQSFLYGWFNQGGGSGYTAADPSATTAEAGHGYWAWFSCTRVVPRGPGQVSVSSPLSAYHASMVGNPSGTSPAVVTGHDFAARWDPGLNGGAGGYTISGYREPQQLAVGEGMWVFAYGDTTVTTRAG